MGSASSMTSTTLDTTRSRSLRREAAIGAVAAAAANAAIWAAGRAADVSFLVSPLIGPAIQVGIVLVVLTTLIAFAVGMGLGPRRPRRRRPVRRRLDSWAALDSRRHLYRRALGVHAPVDRSGVRHHGIEVVAMTGGGCGLALVSASGTVFAAALHVGMGSVDPHP